MGLDISCPACGYDDSVQSVPAIFASGTSTTSGTDYYSGVGVASSGIVPVVGAATIEHTQSTLLADELAPEPPWRNATRLSLFGALASFPAIACVPLTFLALAMPHPELSTTAAVGMSAVFTLLLATPSIVLLSVAARRARRNGRIIRGRRAARAVWSAGFYCHRCHVGYWPDPPAPGVPARQSLSPSQFRWVVWNAGGFADA